MTVGVLGAGQLGRMLALAGAPLGLRFRFLDPAADAPAAPFGELILGAYDDPGSLARLLGPPGERCDVVTFEFENVPAGAARWIAERAPIYPGPGPLALMQDRLAEKTLFRRLGIPTPDFEPVDSLDQLRAATERIGLPCVLKTRREGYDGKGQAVLKSPADLPTAFTRLTSDGPRPLIVEQFVNFTRELSIIAARSRDGRTVCYPLIQNTHEGGILRLSIAPAPGVDARLEARAAHLVNAVLADQEYVGVLAIELFERTGPDGQAELLGNEMAPRVHNSGHWTIEGAVTSQFENHLRAVLGWPLGPAEPRALSAMINLIGALPDRRRILEIPGAHLHDYGKQPRDGRKVGHITVNETDRATLDRRVADVQQLLR